MKMPWKKEDAEPSSPEGEEGTKEGEGEEKKKPESVSDPPPTPTGVQSPFSLPGLAGRSEQEISDLLSLQEMTITEQKRAVAEAGATPLVAATLATPETPPVEVSSEEFFSDPGKATRDIVSDIIQKELKTIIEPFRQDMAKGQARTAWDDAKEDLPNLTEMRPMIEAVLKRSGIHNPTSAQIIGSYDLTVGQAQRQGVSIPGMGEQTEPGSSPSNVRAIPQHQVSTQPIAEETRKTEIEPLNENEARLARERNLTHEQYRELQEQDIGDVLAVGEKS